MTRQPEQERTIEQRWITASKTLANVTKELAALKRELGDDPRCASAAFRDNVAWFNLSGLQRVSRASLKCAPVEVA